MLPPFPQDELAAMAAKGASKEEQDALLAAHQKDVQNLVTKLEADRLRMQSNLQERLKKRREEKLKTKQTAVKQEVHESRRELAEKQRSETERLKADEVSVMFIDCNPWSQICRYLPTVKSLIQVHQKPQT